MPLTKSADDVSVLAEGDLEAFESSSSLRLLEPPGLAVALLSVSERACSAAPKRFKKPAATSKSLLV